MKHDHPQHKRAASFLLLAVGLAAACRSDAPEPAPPPDPNAPPPHMRVQRPWTLRFMRPALLIAEEVYVEGPADLLEHFALRQEPENLAHEQKTTELGLLLTTEVLPGRTGVEIRAQLDGLELAALRKLVVLQRPGEVPVTVRASGDVLYSRFDGTDERRGPTLELVGVRGE